MSLGLSLSRSVGLSAQLVDKLNCEHVGLTQNQTTRIRKTHERVRSHHGTIYWIYSSKFFFYLTTKFCLPLPVNSITNK